MSHNTFGRLFRVTTWGESHGPALGCVVDGCPPGIPLTEADIQPWLDRRRPGQGKFVTQRQEPDAVRILSGVFGDDRTDGQITTGTPISMIIENEDQRSREDRIANDFGFEPTRHLVPARRPRPPRDVHLRRCDLEDTQEPWDATAEEQHAAASFQHQVEPSLAACARIGNVYTGSLYLSLAGLLETQAYALAGSRLGLFSYGSGCTSEFFSGVVGPRAADRVKAAPLAEVLAGRERISIEEYERIMALTAPLDTPPRPGSFRFTGSVDHRRQYTRT